MPAVLTETPPAISPPILPFPLQTQPRRPTVRERLLGYVDLPPEILARIEAHDRELAIHDDGRGGKSTVPLVPLRMSLPAAEWLDEELRRHWFRVQGLNPYAGIERGPKPQRAGATSAYQNEDTGGWAQHKAPYNPSEERLKEFKSAEARQNRMSVRSPS